MRFLTIIVLTLTILLMYNEEADARRGLFNWGRRRQQTKRTYRRPVAPRVEKEIELPDAPEDVRPYDQMMAEGNPRRYTMVYETPKRKRHNYEIF